jgi:hypothetical protein
MCWRHAALAQFHDVLLRDETTVARNDIDRLPVLELIERMEQVFQGPLNPEEEVALGLFKLRIPQFPLEAVREGVLDTEPPRLHRPRRCWCGTLPKSCASPVRGLHRGYLAKQHRFDPSLVRATAPWPTPSSCAWWSPLASGANASTDPPWVWQAAAGLAQRRKR